MGDVKRFQLGPNLDFGYWVDVFDEFYCGVWGGCQSDSAIVILFNFDIVKIVAFFIFQVSIFIPQRNLYRSYINEWIMLIDLSFQ